MAGELSFSPETRESLENAIAAAIAEGENEGVFVGAWVLCAEFTDSEGETWLHTSHSQDSTAWSRMGMFAFALRDEETYVNKEE